MRAFRKSRSAVFLDRDGTINQEVHHLSRPEQLKLLPGASEGLRSLHEAGHPLIVVTNQSVVGRGLLTRDRLDEIHRRLSVMLHAEGVNIAAWYDCPHHPDDGCSCRKPAIGLFERGCQELGISLDQAWMVGDRLSDLQAGRAVGARTILVATGYGRREYRLPQCRECADYYAESLVEAAQAIMRTGSGALSVPYCSSPLRHA